MQEMGRIEKDIVKDKEKNRIMFIVPPLSADKNIKFLTHQVPLGFLYMAGLLEKNGFEVKILDCPLYWKLKRKINENTIKFGLFPEQVEKEIKNFQPDIVGISCSYSMYESDSFDVVDSLKKMEKEINKKILVVVGGAHVSSNPKFVLRNKNIDMVVIGEGELTMLEIAKNFQNNKNIKNIAGTALMNNGKFRINKARPYIQNLDELEPAWHLINFKEYFKHPDNYAISIRSPSVHIITSRGCPGNCVFCSVNTVWGRKWRAMSAKKVADQIELLYKKYRIRHFRINDDNFTIDKKRVVEICREIRKRKLDIKWDTPSGVAAWALDKDILKEMKKTGYYRVTFGIESGCKKSLEYIGKNINLEKINGLIDYCHKLGLWIASFFIIGFPYETKEEVNETVNYIINSKINFPFISGAQPYAGTRMYEDFKKEGLLINKNGFLEKSNVMVTKYGSKYLTAEEIREIRRKTYIRFYLKKIARYSNLFIFYKEFLSKIRTIEDLKYVYKIFKNIFIGFIY